MQWNIKDFFKKKICDLNPDYKTTTDLNKVGGHHLNHELSKHDWD